MMMHKNQSVDLHQFSMIPRADIPRSKFTIQTAHKTTFDAAQLVPFYVDEVLPGDTFSVSTTAFARLTTPIFPTMDNLHMDFFFFFVPNRLIWNNWQKFNGEQDNPGDSISFTIPQCVSPAGGYAIMSLQDYMGLPTVGQVAAGQTVSHANLHPRAYNLIYNQWFRDENLQNSVVVDKGDGPDSPANYTLLKRGKRKDYFTGALPWPQKGSAVSLPLGTTAPVVLSGGPIYQPMKLRTTAGALDGGVSMTTQAGTANIFGTASGVIDPNGALVADLSAATAATINQLRQSFQVQRLLERDARGGTRYTEIIRAHFGVISPDARLQRPEYLGGGSVPVVVSPIAQTSGTSASGTTTPLGNLAAVGTSLAKGIGFTQSFTEHGVLIGLVNVRADLTYQQGMRRMWSRLTRYDFYWPVFAMLGEQAILNKEIYVTGNATDNNVFGYQERWAEYRYNPTQITGLFRSTASGTLDGWHYAQRFTALPTLNSTFITDASDSVVDRTIAVPSQPQFLFDSMTTIRAARPMPLYSVPGLIDHF